MKRATITVTMLGLLLLSGCTLFTEPATPTSVAPTSVTPTTNTPPVAATPTTTTTTTPETIKPKTGSAEYHGSYFTITYPASFTARPTKPTETIDDIAFVVTDEAYFTSPDQSVEFFVFSPQWGGEPTSYLNQADNESFLSETEEPSAVSDTVVFRATLRAYDNSYTRAWESTRSVNGSTELHKVFGIKYKNQAAYDTYKADYLAFKKSLEQFAD